MVRDAFESGKPVVTVEDHAAQGGFGSAVLEAAQEMGLAAPAMTRLGLPDRFIGHGSRSAQLAEAGIDAAGIAAAVQTLLERRSADPIRRRQTQTSADATKVFHDKA